MLPRHRMIAHSTAQIAVITCAWGLPELMRGILGIFLVSRRLASIAARLLEGLSFVIAGIWGTKNHVNGQEHLQIMARMFRN